MKLTHYIYILMAAVGITSCNGDDELTTRDTNRTDNVIALHAGIANGASAATRADGDLYVQFANTTQMRLYVEGTWTGKDPSTITQYTNCTTSAADQKKDGDMNDVHPLSSYTPQLYWDDYGTADPANAENRAKGLAVYGVCVDGFSALPDDLKAITGDTWTSLSWTVKTDGTDVLTRDLSVSNNHGDNSTSEKTGIKFSQRNSTNVDDNLLIYQHMMSKVTFVLKAGNGFTDNKFATAPKVVLTRNKTGETKTEYCYTEGTVNVKTATPVGTTLNPVTAQVKDATNLGEVTEHALIFPGSDFGTADTDIIAQVNADGNIYYVTAKQIRVKLNEVLPSEDTSTRYKTKSGVNYIITVVVNKTGIFVTATIKDWTDVIADDETPLICVTANVGDATAVDATKQRMPSFGFYLSDAAQASATTAYAKMATATRPTDGADGVALWPFMDGSENPVSLYWPNHHTHYYMRGVSPASAIVVDGKITVTSQLYDAAETSMSNLLVGAPVIASGTMCDNPDHISVDMSTNGICARQGKINLTFDYMMSQVEVRLKTSQPASDFDPVPADAVNLANAKVEIVGGYSVGAVDIHAKTVSTSGSIADFEVKHVSTEDGNYRHSAVVPQNLTNDSGDLKFKVTIYQDGSTTAVDDVYFATIKTIQVSENGSKKTISKWESGKHYIYTLELKKTEIKISATITDWVTVTAEEIIWF